MAALLLNGCGVLGGLAHNNTKTIRVTTANGTTTVTSYDYSDNAVFYDSAARHTEAEADRVDKTVKAVMKNSECPGCSPGEKGISRALGSVIVEHIAPTPWNVQRGTTGYDVLKDLANGIALPLGIVTVGAVQMNKKANSQTIVNGKTNNFDRSFTKQETHATGQGNNSTITPPEVQVVQPSYPPEVTP